MADELRIVLLGKTGHGRSSSGNTILGGDFFEVKTSPVSTTHKCTVQSNEVNGKLISIIDTPGFYDTCLTEDQLKPEIMRCITECAPGPHAFVIVLRAGRYTPEETAVVQKITESFGEDAFKYVIVLFTFGDEEIDGKDCDTIEKFVATSVELQDLMDKCRGRCHVIDNEQWGKEQKGYMSNKTQVEELLKTINKMVDVNGGSWYTNEMLQVVEEEIKAETARLQEAKTERDKEELKCEAKQKVYRALIILGGGAGAFLGALFALDLGVIVKLLSKTAQGAKAGVEAAKHKTNIKGVLSATVQAIVKEMS